MKVEEATAKYIATLQQDGRITKERVLEDAARPDSPLHRYFTWDDSEAGHKYRLIEAEKLIRSVEYYVYTETERIPVPEYVRDVRQSVGKPGLVSMHYVKEENPAMTSPTILHKFRQAAEVVDKLVAYCIDVKVEEAAARESLAALQAAIRRLESRQ